MSLLGERYASKGMLEIWSGENKVMMERKLWISIMKIQAQLGLSISVSTISDYEKVLKKIDLESIDSREIELGHDVKARIEEFNALAGHEQIHLGMTSRDLTENVELVQIKQALNLVLSKSRVLLLKLADKAESLATELIVARTHNVPAQLTTLGKKFATWAEELELAEANLENLISRLPIRGIHGAVGTNLDITELLGNKANALNEALKAELGFDQQLNAPSQVYPRSLDFEVISALFQLIAAPSTIATNIRLMSGVGIASEGLPKGKTGSSAMPHKINPRLSERVNSIASILKGHLMMVADLSGSQWNEGDVSCSALRRVALPDALFASDAILEIMIQLLDKLELNHEQIRREIHELLPEISSSTILMLAVKKGVGRELAHKAIKEYSLNRENEGDFFDLIVEDKALQIDRAEIEDFRSNPSKLAGDAGSQALLVAKRLKSRLAGKTELTDFSPSTLR